MPRQRSKPVKSTTKYQGQTASKRTVPPPASTPASTQQNSPGLMGSLFGTVAQGFAFGTGSSLAHRGVDAVVGNNHETRDQVTEVNTVNSSSHNDFQQCKLIYQQYQKCLENQWDANACQEYKDQVNKCMQLS